VRPVSEHFAEAIADPHKAAVKATLLPSLDLPITDGSVRLDATAATRGTLDLTVVDDGTLGLVPSVPSDPLTPYGNLIQAQRGVRYLDNTEELVSLGFFRIDTVDVSDSGDDLELKITAFDRSAQVAEAKFEAPKQIPAGTLFTDAILGLVWEVLPNVTTDFVDSALVTPFVLAWEEGDDRWAAAQNLALALGCDLYFDGDDVLTLRPSGPSQVQATLSEGAGGVLVSAGRNWNREARPNRIIVTGENSGEAAVRGVATDTDPDSPTYYYGPYGRVPEFYSLGWVVTTAQAEDVAQTILAKSIGATQAVSFGAVVNPALEPDDVITITRARTGIDQTFVLDSLTIPLSFEESMSGQTRVQG
jgi:Domain of unknown function (DUF5047)